MKKKSVLISATHTDTALYVLKAVTDALVVDYKGGFSSRSIGYSRIYL